MAAAAKQTTEQKNELLLYRVSQLELAVKEVDRKVSNMDNIKKEDLNEFRDSIMQSFRETRDGLQKQIDDKADQKELADFKKVVFSIISFVSSILAAWIIYSLTNGGK